jgi:hypothetical protein
VVDQAILSTKGTDIAVTVGAPVAGDRVIILNNRNGAAIAVPVSAVLPGDKVTLTNTLGGTVAFMSTADSGGSGGDSEDVDPCKSLSIVVDPNDPKYFIISWVPGDNNDECHYEISTERFITVRTTGEDYATWPISITQAQKSPIRYFTYHYVTIWGMRRGRYSKVYRMARARIGLEAVFEYLKAYNTPLSNALGFHFDVGGTLGPNYERVDTTLYATNDPVSSVGHCEPLAADCYRHEDADEGFVVLLDQEYRLVNGEYVCAAINAEWRDNGDGTFAYAWRFGSFAPPDFAPMTQTYTIYDGYYDQRLGGIISPEPLVGGSYENWASPGILMWESPPQPPESYWIYGNGPAPHLATNGSGVTKAYWPNGGIQYAQVTLLFYASTFSATPDAYIALSVSDPDNGILEVWAWCKGTYDWLTARWSGKPSDLECWFGDIELCNNIDPHNYQTTYHGYLGISLLNLDD